MTASPGPRALCWAYGLSGACALAYQVVWYHAFVDGLGAASTTFLVVLCAFIGGLGLGAASSSRFFRVLSRLTSDRGLRSYGLVELLLTLSALVLLLLTRLPAASRPGGFPYEGVTEGGLALLVPSAASLALKIGLASVAVGIPCFLMGTTFPYLCSLFPDDARFPSRLYGANTLGACVSVLLTEFWGLRNLGYMGCLAVAAMGTLALGLFFLRLPATPGTPARGAGTGRNVGPVAGTGPDDPPGRPERLPLRGVAGALLRPREAHAGPDARRLRAPRLLLHRRHLALGLVRPPPPPDPGDPDRGRLGRPRLVPRGLAPGAPRLRGPRRRGHLPALGAARDRAGRRGHDRARRGVPGLRALRPLVPLPSGPLQPDPGEARRPLLHVRREHPRLPRRGPRLRVGPPVGPRLLRPARVPPRRGRPPPPPDRRPVGPASPALGRRRGRGRRPGGNGAASPGSRDAPRRRARRGRAKGRGLAEHAAAPLLGEAGARRDGVPDVRPALHVGGPLALPRLHAPHGAPPAPPRPGAEAGAPHLLRRRLDRRRDPPPLRRRAGRRRGPEPERLPPQPPLRAAATAPS